MPTPDQKLAHELFTQLRTTIATQELPYQRGLEQPALDSLYEVFKKARGSLAEQGVSRRMARIVSRMLNTATRPFMAKWHRGSEQGLLKSRDGGDAFRAELADLQEALRQYARIFSKIAYGSHWKGTSAVPPMTAAQMKTLFAAVPFGIPITPDFPMAARINASETVEVAARRAGMRVPMPSGHDAVGVAFSGGGIRSATFCLGVSQVLAREDLFQYVDFLSTVSGGGYTGSFLTQVLGRGGSWQDVAAPHGPDTDAIRRLRQRAKYITARNLWDAWGMVTATVAGMFMNWTAPLLVLIVLAVAAVAIGTAHPGESVWFLALGAGALFSAISAPCYFSFLRSNNRCSMYAGWSLAGAVAVGLMALLGLGLSRLFGEMFRFDQKDHWENLGALFKAFQASSSWRYAGKGGISLGVIATFVPVALRYLPFLKQPSVRTAVTKTALIVAAIFVPILGVFVFLLLCAFGHLADVGVGHIPGVTALLIVAVGLLFMAVFCLNLNLTGPHRLYRAGLSQTFVELGFPNCPSFRLSAINASLNAPYHLINAAVNLPSSNHPGLRERMSDFFLFSKYWTGSPVVGYEPSFAWKMNGNPADLASAMAISGAAFSANMGLGSIPPLRALLAFLNVRLGFWIRFPSRPGMWGLPKWDHPGFACLLREMSGLCMDEKDRWLNLSDGGHIENLAVYELLRRRCKFIICVDGEADPTYTFQGVLTLVRHAQIDFGVRIAPDLSELVPDQETRVSRSHFHFCRIEYPAMGGAPAATGLLLYLKLSLTGDESALIKRYRINHPDFPHQTTLDQFFDEEQFEAYRQLGVHVAEGLFKPALLGKTKPRTFQDWFQALAKSLLEPVP